MISEKEIFKGLNDEQKEAVTTTEGPVRVIAAAGSGKTRVLTNRFAYLVKKGIAPNSILCVTFTNKAAGEMKGRIHKLVGDRDTAYITTFHGLCFRILQEDINVLNFSKSFDIVDDNKMRSLLQVVYDENDLTMKDIPFKEAKTLIKRCKDETYPSYYEDMICFDEERLDGLYQKARAQSNLDDTLFFGYLYQCKKCVGLDFDDLMNFVIYIFENFKDVLLKWQKKFAYIMVDEFQDVNRMQYNLMKMLAEYHNNVFIVGDPDQTIYSWRGSKIEYLLYFNRDFEGCKTIEVNRNYRSTPEIIAAANGLISKNRNRIEKEICPELDPSGKKPELHWAESVDAEANYVAGKIKELVEIEGYSYDEIAILYRAHYLSRSIEKAMITNKIPFVIYKGVQFFERKEVRTALAYLQMINDPDDNDAFLLTYNTPPRNIGKTRTEFLQNYAENNKMSFLGSLKYNCTCGEIKGTKAGEFIDLIEEYSEKIKGAEVSISNLFEELMSKSGYYEYLRGRSEQDRLDNLAELKQSIVEYELTCGEETDIHAYLNFIKLYTDQDRIDKNSCVKVMTVHAAKGLEFPCVFLYSMVENIFPSAKVQHEESMEEERRLAFVAVTRAKERLFVTLSGGEDAMQKNRLPSRFVINIRKGLFNITGAIPQDDVEVMKERIGAEEFELKKKTFKAGQRVEIKGSSWGKGTILKVLDNSYSIKFDNLATEREIMFNANLTLAAE